VFGAHRILVVDDGALARDAVREGTRGEPYSLDFAAHPAEALAILNRGGADAVMAKQQLPGMTGLDFLQCVRQLWPQALRILLGGDAETTSSINASRDGLVHRVLLKPWCTGDFKATLRAWFQVVELERKNLQLSSMVQRQFEFIQILEGRRPDGSPVLELTSARHAAKRGRKRLSRGAT
jgi:CheY-like chemotaxis protein